MMKCNASFVCWCHMNWLVIWFFLLIFVTTVNKLIFSTFKCPYHVSLTLVRPFRCASILH